jgi:CheY-like chemotaxis protein
MAKTILIVEDEPRNLILLRDLLQRFGYETLVATDADQGVESIEASIPDFVLMYIITRKKRITGSNSRHPN